MLLTCFLLFEKIFAFEKKNKTKPKKTKHQPTSVFILKIPLGDTTITTIKMSHDSPISVPFFFSGEVHLAVGKKL